MRKVLLIGLMASVVGCSGMEMSPSAQTDNAPKDGELAFPSDYASYPTFLQNIQKPNAVRDLYINQTGAKASKGETFANGSVLVMAIHNVKKDANGSLMKDGNGQLMKDGLAKVFVMQKGKGWGNNAPKGQKNGDWIYAAFKPNGERLNIEYTKCRSCHMPLGETKDYVHRYDEYFMKRGHAY